MKLLKLHKNKILILFFGIFFLAIPVISSAQIVPDCGPGGCGWDDLVQLAKNSINFLIWIAIPISALMFAWAGFLYISAGGSQDKIKQAHSLFLNVGIGLVIVLGAWLIVSLILFALTDIDLGDAPARIHPVYDVLS